MAAIVTITSSALSPSTKTIPCQIVTYAGKRDIIANPNANPGSLVQAQTQGHSNPLISIQGVHFISGSTNLTYSDVLTLHKLNYDGTNAPLLTVTYGLSGSTQVLSDFTGATTGIKVVLKDFNFPISAVDSRDGYLPVGSLNFQETA